MSDVTIHFRDGGVQVFKDNGRAGGICSQRVTYEGNFVIVRDCWNKQTSFPSELVKCVVTEQERGSW